MPGNDKGKSTNKVRDDIQSDEAGEADLVIKHTKQASHGAEPHIRYDNLVSLVRFE